MLEKLKTRKEQLEARGEKGFTLMEMLIVIAIIAILIAIAIPLFTSQLNAARHATDQANARALYAQMQTDYMLNGSVTVPTAASGTKTVTYDGTTYTFESTCSELSYAEVNDAPALKLVSNSQTDVFGTTDSNFPTSGATKIIG